MAKRQKITRAEKIAQTQGKPHPESTYAHKTRMERAAEFQEREAIARITLTGSQSSRRRTH